MKYLLILFLIMTHLITNGQILNLEDLRFKGSIESVLEKSKKYPNNWRTYSFDSLSRIIERKTFLDNNLIQTVIWTYLDLDSIYITKEKIDTELITKISFFDFQKKLKRFEEYGSKDPEFPMIIETNIEYLNGFIQQYNRILLNHGDTTDIEFYKFDYNQDRSKIIIRKNDNKNISSMTITLVYDKNGNLKRQIIDNSNPSIVLGGARTWSKSRPDKFQSKYKYDKFGNWIKSYSITHFRMFGISTRTINYK